MAKVILNKNKGLREIERIMDGLAKDQNYWNSFIEEELLILTGYINDIQYYRDCDTEKYLREEIFSEIIKTKYGVVCKDTVRADRPTVYITEEYKYKDVLRKEHLCRMNAARLDTFTNFGFKLPNGKVYITSYRLDDSSFWKFLDKFLEIEEPEEAIKYTELGNYLLPIRWLGAYNTNANGKGKLSFEEVLRYETSPKDREVAAQIFVDEGEAKEVSSDSSYYINREVLSYSKVGIVYQPASCREAYEEDVWSINVGPYLVPSRNDYKDNLFDQFDHWIDAEQGFFKLLETLYLKDYFDDSLIYREMIGWKRPDIYIYNGEHNMRLFNDILCEAGYTIEEALELLSKYKWVAKRGGDRKDKNYFRRTTLRRSFGNDIKRAIRRLEIALGKDEMCFYCRRDTWNAHSEGFIRIGEKPIAIAIRGEIREETLRVIEKIAKEKDLSIIEL